MARYTILVVYGGESPEHDVSIGSAHNIFAALDNEKYDVQLVYIDRYGKWWLTKRIDGNHIGCPQLIPVLGQGQFITLPGERIIRPDVMFPVLHGHNGEDGAIQGVAQMLHVPCVGPNVLAAAVTMDKDVTKRLLMQAGVPVVPWITWDSATEETLSFTAATEKLGNTLFIKPNTAGSSVGVTKATTSAQFSEGLRVAAQHGRYVLIEQALRARELELAVIGTTVVSVTSPGEIEPGDEFYSYDDKYDAASTAKIVIPAEVDEDLSESLKELAKKAYVATRCVGMARVDFFLNDNGDIYCNEINSIPGFTTISMFPKLWHAQGKKYPQLIDGLVRDAIDEYNRSKKKYNWRS